LEQIPGYIGTALVIFGYFPQIYHLLKEHCSAGLSTKAFVIWTAASLLFLIHAITIGDIIFEIVQGISLICSLVIAVFCRIYKDQYCQYHLSKIEESDKLKENKKNDRH
jgi:uncharacterized protein with PQ loop repeat